jgi:hypothetical protein
MLHRMRNELRQAAAEMVGFENVFEDASKIRPGRFIGINRHRPIAEIQRPNVIKSEDMIDVTVCNEYSVEVADVCAQSLLPKIGRSIDENCLTGVFYKN